MSVMPILHALRRHKAGALLISLQIALTLMIVVNAVFIISTRIHRIERPTGLNESNLLVIDNVFLGGGTQGGAASKTALDARERADLATLRGLPGVVDAYATNTVPLAEDNWTGGADIHPHARLSSTNPSLARVAFFMGDTHALRTLGVKLVAGRNFHSDEIGAQSLRDPLQPPVTIVSQALAHKLYPHTSAVGKTVYLNGSAKPTTIVGVVRRLQSSSIQNWGSSFAWSTALLPVRFLTNEVFYVVRVRPGDLAAARHNIPAALFKLDRMRVIPDHDGVRSFAQIRHAAYRADRGMAIMMAMVSVILLAVTAAGIVGLSSFWVGQRRRQIGVRRALGATRRDILSYFLAENALITGAGLALGVVGALLLNHWLMMQFELSRLSPAYLVAGALTLVLLGQGAAFAPALRASRIPPVEATRTV